MKVLHFTTESCQNSSYLTKFVCMLKFAANRTFELKCVKNVTNEDHHHYRLNKSYNILVPDSK